MMSETPKYEIFNDIPYCDSFCPYHQWHGEEERGYCRFLNKELTFYDWFIAECVDELKYD
jgi:hypothetical protein